MKRSRDAQLGVGLGQIGAAAAAAMAGNKNQFEAVGQQQMEQARSIPDQYLKEVQFEKEDPNSAMSKGYRQLASSMGFDIQGTASAADLERLMPQLSNIYNQQEAHKARADQNRENRASRREELQMRLAAMKEQKKTAKSDKEERFVQSLRKELTAGQMGKMYGNYATANRMGSAIEQFAKDPGAYKDYATLMGGLKALQGDDSVVREAEVRLGMSATSLGNKVKNWSERLITGKSLQPSQRAEMVQAARILAEVARQQYIDAADPVLQQADAQGIPRQLILNDKVFKPIEVPEIKDYKKKKINNRMEVIPVAPIDVDAMSDEEVEAELKKRGL